MNLKSSVFRFLVDENILKTELFKNLTEFFPNKNPNWPVIVGFSNFSG